MSLMSTSALWEPAEPTADYVAVTPSGGISSTTLQDALEELDTKKLAIADIDDTPVNGVTLETFYSWLIGRTSKTTPVDADTLPLSDSVVGSTAKLTWANLKAHLDTLYLGVVPVVSAATPVLVFKDSSCTDSDVNFDITASATDGSWQLWPVGTAGVVASMTTMLLTGPVNALRFTAAAAAGVVEIGQ